MSRSRRFSKGVGHFECRFQREGASPTNHCRYQSSRVIALSCGIKISVVRHLVLSQSTRVTDRQMDGRTDRITTPKTALAYARTVKIKNGGKTSMAKCNALTSSAVKGSITQSSVIGATTMRSSYSYSLSDYQHIKPPLSNVHY